MASLSPPSPPSSGDPLPATLNPSAAAVASSSSSSLSPSLLIIAALLAFVFFASASIHLLLRFLSRPSPSPSPSSATLPHAHRSEVVSVVVEGEEEDEKERLIESLPLFTMASALAALPKSSPDCAVCLSPFTPDSELRLLPACRHAFHAACVDAWLRTTPSCPLCRAAVSLPHPPLPPLPTSLAQGPLESRSGNHSRSFRVEIGSVSNRRSSSTADDRRTYSLGSFDYRVDEEVEAVVSRIALNVAVAAKEAKPVSAEEPAPPGEHVAEAAGSRGWLREYVDRLASSASSFSGRWSARWSQSQHSHRQDDSWLWDAESAAMPAPRADEEEAGFMALYRWIIGV